MLILWKAVESNFTRVYMRERTGVKVRERKGSCPTGKNEDERESVRGDRGEEESAVSNM